MTEDRLKMKLIEDYDPIGPEERNIHGIVRRVKQQGSGSGGEEAIVALLRAMIHCGLTSAAIGTLGVSWQRDIITVIDDQDALDRVARHLHWGEDPQQEEEE